MKQPRHRTSGRLLLAALALAIPMLISSSLTTERASAAAQSTATMTLTSQSSYVPAEGTFELAFSWSGELTADLTVGGTIFAPITSELGVQESPVDLFAQIKAVPLTQVPRNEAGNYVLSIPLRSVADGDPTRTLILQEGVFPVNLDIRNSEGATLASLRTNMIRLPTETAEGELISVAVLLEVASAEGLTIDRTSVLLSRHPLLPIAVQLGDGVLTQLENSPELADQFRTSLGDRPVIAAPALNLDPSALASIDRGDFYGLTRDQTFERLRSLGLTPSLDTVPLDVNLTSSGIDLLRSLGATIVVDTGSRSRSTGFMTGSTGPITLIQVADDLTTSLRGRTRVVERAHRLLATLAIRSQTDLSPVVIGGNGLRDVPVEAIEIILTALDGTGPINNVGLARVSNEAAFPIRPDEQPSQDLSDAAAPITEFLKLLDTYRLFFVSGNRPPSRFDARLLEAVSPDLNQSDRLRAIVQLRESLEGELSGIELPDGQSVTLAAQRAKIPITVDNQSDGIREVLLTFESDKIRVDQNRTIVELPPGVSTISIDLEALSLGQSPLEITIFTPDESAQLATTRFGVRSTAVPGLGMLLSAAALVFLLGWWIVTTTRERAVRKHPAVVGHGSS